MTYKRVFPIQNEVVYANGTVPYINEESLDPSKALLRVDFNSFRTFIDSNFSRSVLSLGLTEVPRFIVTEYHLEGPYAVPPKIQDAWSTIDKSSTVLTHLAPLDMDESDYVPTVRSHIVLYTNGKSFLGIESKGRKLIDHLSEGIHEILSVDPSKMIQVDDTSFAYDFINERNNTVGNLRTNFMRDFKKIDLDVLSIDQSNGSEIVKQYLQLVSGFNRNRLPSDITMRGNFYKGFAFRPDIRGKNIDDLLNDSDILLESEFYKGYRGEKF